MEVWPIKAEKNSDKDNPKGHPRVAGSVDECN